MMFGDHFRPFGRRSWAKLGPKPVSIAYLVRGVLVRQTLQKPIQERFLGSQDGGQNGRRSAQDGSKTVWQSVFVPDENRLDFDTCWVPFGGDAGPFI